MRKRVLALILAGTMVFGLTACNKSGKNDETTSTDATETTETTETTQAEPVKQTTELTDYSEYVTLGDYSGLDIAVDAAAVTDEQIQNYIDTLVTYYNNNMVEPEHITTGTTKVGDVINLDYSGSLDGTAFDGGTATSQTYTVGSGRFISDLDEQLAGLEVGKEYELKCTFPEDYTQNTELAGKETVFTVTVNYIEGDKDEYEWGDEFANVYTNGEFATADAYRENIAATLLEKAQSNQQTEYENALWTKIIENSTISYPEDKVSALYDDYYNYYVQYFTYYASFYGMDMESFLSSNYNMTTDDLSSECTTMAQQTASQIMVACQIFKNLGMTLTDEQYNEKAQAMATENEFDSAEALVEAYGEENLREVIIVELISDYILENNNMVINE